MGMCLVVRAIHTDCHIIINVHVTACWITFTTTIQCATPEKMSLQALLWKTGLLCHNSGVVCFKAAAQLLCKRKIEIKLSLQHLLRNYPLKEKLQSPWCMIRN